jgi:hypothetical protein
MADEYVVTAPYVTPKVRDNVDGGWVYRGFYKDAVLRSEQIEPESLRHHLDGGMLAEREQPAPEPAAPEPVVETPPAVVRPKVGDPKETWIAFAVTQRPKGQSEADARTEAEATSKADLIAAFGG